MLSLWGACERPGAAAGAAGQPFGVPVNAPWRQVPGGWKRCPGTWSLGICHFSVDSGCRRSCISCGRSVCAACELPGAGGLFPEGASSRALEVCGRCGWQQPGAMPLLRRWALCWGRAGMELQLCSARILGQLKDNCINVSIHPVPAAGNPAKGEQKSHLGLQRWAVVRGLLLLCSPAEPPCHTLLSCASAVFRLEAKDGGGVELSFFKLLDRKPECSVTPGFAGGRRLFDITERS